VDVARVTAVRAVEAVEVARVRLAQAIGAPAEKVDAAPLTATSPGPPPAFDARAHPELRARAAAVDAARSEVKTFSRSYYPRLGLLLGLWGRGSGIEASGAMPGGANGLLPDTVNWAAGVMVTFPVFDVFDLRWRERAAESRVVAESSQYREVQDRLAARTATAHARLRAALAAAETTPVQLQAAREAHTQTETRYRVGLAPIIDVADTSRLLTQAEIEDALARLGVWRAWLELAHAGGDLAPFLSRASESGSP
jgi:outer membrane protein TolC